MTTTTRREIGGLDTIHLRFQPASYTARFYVRDAAGLVEKIRAMPECSARSYLIAVDRKAGIPDPDGDWGEIILTVKAADEHLAERAMRKILEKAQA
jgi:hypothetical protein